jgi:chemotaxis protein CheD
VDAFADRIDIFLQPGEYYFGDETTCIRTLLGSCVSFTAWHPRHRIGAMSHFLLPTNRAPGGAPFDGRYCDEAVLWFLDEATKRATQMAEYEIKVFGGGDMFAPAVERRGADRIARDSIGRQNVDRVLGRLKELGKNVAAQHIGGTGHRNLIFDVATGDVWVRHVPMDSDSRKAA